MDTAPATRPSLLARLRDPRDAQAWCVFQDRYAGLILGYARARGLQPADAEDVLQLVMAKLVAGMRSFEYRPEAGGFRRYLRTIVRGEIIRHLSRHAGPGAAVSMVDDAAEDDLDADDLFEQEWMRHHFRLAWATVKRSVDETSLDVFRLLLAGVSTAGVAESMGMTEPTVRKVKQRISERLREAITEQLRDETAGDAGPD